MRTSKTSKMTTLCTAAVLALTFGAGPAAADPAAPILMDVVQGEAGESGTPLTLTANEPLTLTVKDLEWGPDSPPPKETVTLTRELDKGQTYSFSFLPAGDMPTLALCARPKSGAELCWMPSYSGEDGSLMMDAGFRLKP